MLNHKFRQSSLDNALTAINKAIKRLNVRQSTQIFAHIARHASYHLKSLQISRKSDSRKGPFASKERGVNTIIAYETSLFPLVSGLA